METHETTAYLSTNWQLGGACFIGTSGSEIILGKGSRKGMNAALDIRVLITLYVPILSDSRHFRVHSAPAGRRIIWGKR